MCVSVGGNSDIEHRTAMQDDPQRRRPDITRAKNYIGWQPRVGCLIVNGWNAVVSSRSFVEITLKIKITGMLLKE